MGTGYQLGIFCQEYNWRQIVDASDSIGANIAEGSGKGSNMEFKRRAYKRSLLKK